MRQKETKKIKKKKEKEKIEANLAVVAWGQRISAPMDQSPLGAWYHLYENIDGS